MLNELNIASIKKYFKKNWLLINCLFLSIALAIFLIIAYYFLCGILNLDEKLFYCFLVAPSIALTIGLMVTIDVKQIQGFKEK